MKVLYYECFSGISGDMNLGLMVDLGVDFEYLKAELVKLGVDEEYELIKKTGLKHGITGTKIDVILMNEEDHDHNHKHDHDHKHDHKHSHSHHHESAKKDSTDINHHVHRGYKDIEKIILASGLNERVKKLSLDIFMVIAVAEGKVHGKSYDEVHFHEVGATDSIIDIVGSAICLDALGVDAVWSSTVELGGGFVKCAHGLMPVPAPATIEILKGAMTKTGRVQKETTTPTGAAILASTVTNYTDRLEGRVERVGYGLGTRDLEIPNVVRGSIVEVEERAESIYLKDEIIEIQANIDDMKPEYMDYVLDLLYEKHALEVFQTPVMMKKGRVGTLLTVLAQPESLDALSQIILTHTTAIGCRYSYKERMKLRREIRRCETKYGTFDVKVVFEGDYMLRFKAEYDQLKKAASEYQVTLDQIEKSISKVMEEYND